MDLKTYKKIHRKDSPDQKLDMIYETANLIANARKNAAEASLSGGNALFYYKTENHMRRRLIWLLDEIRNTLQKYETHCEAMEEYLFESGQDQFL